MEVMMLCWIHHLADPNGDQCHLLTTGLDQGSLKAVNARIVLNAAVVLLSKVISHPKAPQMRLVSPVSRALINDLFTTGSNITAKYAANGSI